MLPNFNSQQIIFFGFCFCAAIFWLSPRTQRPGNAQTLFFRNPSRSDGTCHPPRLLAVAVRCHAARMPSSTLPRSSGKPMCGQRLSRAKTRPRWYTTRIGRCPPCRTSRPFAFSSSRLTSRDGAFNDNSRQCLRRTHGVGKQRSVTNHSTSRRRIFLSSVVRDRFLNWISSWIFGSPWLCASVKPRLAPRLEVQVRRERLRRRSRFHSQGWRLAPKRRIAPQLSFKPASAEGDE